MRLLWTLVKVVLALVLVVPVCIIVLAAALGILGTLVGLAVFALKLAFLGMVVWGGFRLISALLRGPAAQSRPAEIMDAPRVDPHYEAAMRELDQELGVRQ